MKAASIWVLAISLLLACGGASKNEDPASAKTLNPTNTESGSEMKVDTAAGMSKEEQELLELLPVIL